MRRCSRETNGYVIYAEFWNEREERLEKGVFLSMSEFLPYRAKGWLSSPSINDIADDYLDAIEEDKQFGGVHQRQTQGVGEKYESRT